MLHLYSHLRCAERGLGAFKLLLHLPGHARVKHPQDAHRTVRAMLRAARKSYCILRNPGFEEVFALLLQQNFDSATFCDEEVR